jgi:hypothetical protein
VSFVYDGREIPARTVNLSRVGAFFESTLCPDLGTELLLGLRVPDEPRLTANLQATVVRTEPSTGRTHAFAVSFGDAISRDPASLGRFLNQVLGISNGLIQGREVPGGGRTFFFSFSAVHQEGSERLQALQSSLFGSLEEVDEVDQMLSSFGNQRTTETPDNPSLEPLPARGRSRGQQPAGRKDMALGLESILGLDRESAVQTPCSSDPVAHISQQAQPCTAPCDELEHEEAPSDPSPDASAPSVSEPAPAAPSPAVEKKDAGSSGLLRRLFTRTPKPGKPAKGLPSADPVPAMVAQQAVVPVWYAVGTDRRRATATRLYCSGMKCTTSDELPPLYSAVTLLIPTAGSGKGRNIEILGDVTRLRQGGEGQEGLFEVRFSMRTTKANLETYRALLKTLGAQEG